MGKVVATKNQLYDLQKQIEEMTMQFDEQTLHKSTTNILNILIDENRESAKFYIFNKLNKENEEDRALLSELSQFTLEGLIVHVLCVLFRSSDVNIMVRVATLIEQLEGHVRSHINIVRQRRLAKEIAKGNIAPEDIEEFKESISISIKCNSTSDVAKKGKSHYTPKAGYVICNFDISLLPIKLNLPMVHPPIDWSSSSAKFDDVTLSDLKGGNLSQPNSEMYGRYSLLTSTNVHNFYLELYNQEKICNIMNTLQNQPFQINSEFLQYIIDNEKTFVKHGLLAPRFIAYMNLRDSTGKLRSLYMKNDFIKSKYSYNELLLILQKDMQKARYEHLIFDLASAFKGFPFYLPAFLDFWGRIYRCGVLHFHERDLSRSLVEFAVNEPSDIEQSSICKDIALASTSFHFRTLKSVNAVSYLSSSIETELEKYNVFPSKMKPTSMDEEKASVYVQLSTLAKHPFQFLSGYLSIRHDQWSSISCIPITQDASASAYQIMSYLLLDENIAKSTNLFPSNDGEIKDIYLDILEALNSYISDKKKYTLDENDEFSLVEDHEFSSTINKLLDRKIVKSIFMPIIYGKTVISTTQDIKKSILSQFLSHKECFSVAQLCFDFWREKFQNMDCLIRLISCIGWLISSSDRAVLYEVDNFITIQDYMKMVPINISIYDQISKKRCQVTLRVPSDKRDKRKTEVATFVNFIHQKDAHIAMTVVEHLQMLKVPIYTVHDNFITTPAYSSKLPLIYSSAMKSLGSPLEIINQFLYCNLVQHLPMKDEFPMDLSDVIPSDTLKRILDLNLPSNMNKTKVKKKMTAKSGIPYYRRSYGEDITFSIGPAIPLTDDSGCLLSKSVVYSNIYKLITKQAEIDDGDHAKREVMNTSIA
ncbi:probable DNA-directed RNA polymerase [Rutidosis leptorrhynchoides]|uniref:probable DNA-directed RNA polymerase n=1 Tax=Rutidosis leptorrhynchoides TaxID=125765 RepID=UPI003A9A0A44